MNRVGKAIPRGTCIPQFAPHPQLTSADNDIC